MIAIHPGRCLQRCGFVAVAGILLLIPARIFAQADEHANHATVGWVPEEILDRPVALRTGIGVYHEKVTTSSALAQKFYDQGVAYLHSYVWIEAARSFHQALRSDPKMAMAYLGLSYAYSPMDYPAARAALERAESLSAAANDRERRRIAIRRAQLDAMAAAGNAEAIPKLLAFHQEIDDALAAYPDDVELLLLRGHAEEPTPFGDGGGCVASAITYYQRAVAISPDTFAAHHFAAERQLTPFTEYAAFNRKDWPEFLLNRSDFGPALGAAQEMAGSRSALSRATGHCLAGIALVALHRSGEAEAQLNSARMEARGLNRADAAAVSPYLDLLELALMTGSGQLADAP